MSTRRGEKIGWIGGWLGGFVWVLPLGVFLLSVDRTLLGSLAVADFLAAVVLVLWLAPWRHPRTEYWKLMLPLYGLFLAAAVPMQASVVLSDPEGPGLASFAWIFPIFLPLILMRDKRWDGA